MMQDIAGELERVHERMHALAYSRYCLRKIPKMYYYGYNFNHNEDISAWPLHVYKST